MLNKLDLDFFESTDKLNKLDLDFLNQLTC